MKVDKLKQDSGGGFLDLSDWNMKSRKKFYKTPDLSERSKQKRSSDVNINIPIPITQFHPSKESNNRSRKGCSSSLIDEDDYRKSPGVVARLMGLDSLPNPTSSFNDTQSNRFFDSRYVRKRIELEQKDFHQQIDRKHKVIEKFQTESLPRKSDKSVHVTRQKLLSPIKSSRFGSSDDPIRIMQVGSKTPSRKPSESNAARSLKGQSMNKSWDGCLDRKPFMEDGKKSVSLALQAKINVKTREGSSTLRKSSTNSVLKQNNQKQNCLNGRGNPAAKSPVTLTNSQRRKPVSGKSSSKIPAKSMNKTVNQRKRDKNEGDGYVVRSNGSDVVSFTFTSPISRTPIKSIEKKNALLADNHGTFLDQKLREINITTIFQDKRNQGRIYKDDSCPGFSSNVPLFKDQELVGVFSQKLTTMEVETESEPSYVDNILFNIKSMFEDFSVGRTQKIVNPRLFDILEAKRPILGKKNEAKLRRKLVFDCVSECVDLKCRVWLRGLLVVRRKKRLAKEVCNKISGWERMKDCMVDELVDKDMSSDQHQKWLDFDVEAFEVGVEIERRLLDSLINEVVADILVL